MTEDGILLGAAGETRPQGPHHPLVVRPQKEMSVSEPCCNQRAQGQFNCHHLSPPNITALGLPPVREAPG